ncbi:MAG: hypothetical protein IT376_12605 [Polyangiaceae bacterium]|nr:hypothetical protein [Polyangiaceae bacterium]
MQRPRRLALALLVAWGVSGVAGAARAEASDRAVVERLARIERVLAAEAPAARAWRTSWLVTYGGLTAVQGAGALVLEDRGRSIDLAVGAAKSALGFGAVLLRPWSPVTAVARLRALPEGTPAERRAKLREAERLLDEAAADEERGVGWLARIAGNVVNLAGMTYLFIAHQRYASGWLSLPTGLAVGELQLRTQPVGAMRAQRSLGVGVVVQPAASQGWTVGLVAPW